MSTVEYVPLINEHCGICAPDTPLPHTHAHMSTPGNAHASMAANVFTYMLHTCVRVAVYATNTHPHTCACTPHTHLWRTRVYTGALNLQSCLVKPHYEWVANV